MTDVRKVWLNVVLMMKTATCAKIKCRKGSNVMLKCVGGAGTTAMKIFQELKKEKRLRIKGLKYVVTDKELL